MIFQDQANPLNDTTTIGCLHGLSTFTKLYSLTILDDCFSLTDLRIVLLEVLYGVLNFVSFDQFQIKIFNFLVLFECLLLVLLIFIWAKYNSDIYERFLSNGWLEIAHILYTSSQKEEVLILILSFFSDTIVDELKEDVSQLKLPKSYTPRI